MNLKIFEVRNTTTKTARRTALVLLAAAFVSLPLHGQQASGSDSAASAPDLNAADQAIPRAVTERLPAMNKRIEQITEKSPMDPTGFALDDGATAGSSTSWGNPDPQEPEHPTNQKSSGTNSNYALKGNFFQRLGQFYRQDWAGTNPAGPSPAKRGLPAPIDSPPFPFSDWGYGGSPDIGAPDGNTYPLMSALKLNNSRTKIYGWAAASIDFSTSSQNNFPLSCYVQFCDRIR